MGKRARPAHGASSSAGDAAGPYGSPFHPAFGKAAAKKRPTTLKIGHREWEDSRGSLRDGPSTVQELFQWPERDVEDMWSFAPDIMKTTVLDNVARPFFVVTDYSGTGNGEISVKNLLSGLWRKGYRDGNLRDRDRYAAAWDIKEAAQKCLVTSDVGLQQQPRAFESGGPQAHGGHAARGRHGYGG